DRGCQYTSYAFGKRCQEAGVMPSMGSVGDCYDNALAESFWATLEREVLSRRLFKTKAEAKLAIFSWIERWYHPHRRHSSLGYRSPMNYERHALEHRAAGAMDQSTFNHGKSGHTNPKGRSRWPLLELYTRSLRNEREEKIGHRTSAACGGRLRLCYTLDEGKESERETTNCPPKRVRSKLSRGEHYARGRIRVVAVGLYRKAR